MAGRQPYEGNYLVQNQGVNPLTNFNFMLRVEMAFDLPCKSVRAFTKENEYEMIQEGGLNDFVHMRRKPISRPFTFEVERYAGVDYFDPLPNGAELALPVLLMVSAYQNTHANYVPFLVNRTYVFTGCTVIKKTFGELSAEQSGLLIETTTIAYRQLLSVTNPVATLYGDAVTNALTKPKPMPNKKNDDDKNSN